jgi:hypothetical protein
VDFTELNAGTKSNRTPIEDIGTDLKTDYEEAIVYLLTTEGKRLQTPPFPTREDAEEWLRLFRSYAYQRPDEVGGRVVVTGNSARDKTARFSVTEYKAPASE